MPIPPYVAHLRTMVGAGAALDAGRHGGRAARRGGRRREVLLVRRSDNGAWTPVTGIVDPGEHPHVTAVREVEEEACVVAEVERLVWVSATEVVTHVNGDLGQYLDHTFRCRWVSGEPRPGDDESTDARWFALDALPEMAERHRDRIAVAVRQPAPTSASATDRPALPIERAIRPPAA